MYWKLDITALESHRPLLVSNKRSLGNDKFNVVCEQFNIQHGELRKVEGDIHETAC